MPLNVEAKIPLRRNKLDLVAPRKRTIDMPADVLA